MYTIEPKKANGREKKPQITFEFDSRSDLIFYYCINWFWHLFLQYFCFNVCGLWSKEYGYLQVDNSQNNNNNQNVVSHFYCIINPSFMTFLIVKSKKVKSNIIGKWKRNKSKKKNNICHICTLHVQHKNLNDCLTVNFDLNITVI